MRRDLDATLLPGRDTLPASCYAREDAETRCSFAPGTQTIRWLRARIVATVTMSREPPVGTLLAPNGPRNRRVRCVPLIFQTTMNKFLLAAAIACTVTATPAVASAQSCDDIGGNLVKNCSFENPDGEDGADYPSAPLNDWTANPVGVVERWTNSFGGFGAKDGVSHVELKVDQSTTIWQQIATVAGTEYTLRYSAAHRVNGDNTSQIDVYFGSTLGGGATMISSTGTTLVDGFVWYDFEATFMGVDNGYLEFRSMGSDPTYGDHLDNVSVFGPTDPSVVPEPSTYAMMVIGLGGMFAARRRRQS